MGINQSVIDLIFSVTGIALLCIVFALLVFYKRASKMLTIKLYIGFSLLVSCVLVFLLVGKNYHEYSRIYFLAQDFSYLIEVIMCIELTEMIIKKNYIILMIFGPVVLAVMVLFVVRYNSPTSLTEFTYPGFAGSTLCGFLLFIIWQAEENFNDRLNMPYSGITFCIGLFIALRFAIMIINQHYEQSHWNIVGRLYPINELIFIGLLLRTILIPEVKPEKLTIDDLAVVCRDCGCEYPRHKIGCKNRPKIMSATP